MANVLLHHRTKAWPFVRCVQQLDALICGTHGGRDRLFSHSQFRSAPVVCESQHSRVFEKQHIHVDSGGNPGRRSGSRINNPERLFRPAFPPSSNFSGTLYHHIVPRPFHSIGELAANLSCRSNCRFSPPLPKSNSFFSSSPPDPERRLLSPFRNVSLHRCPISLQRLPSRASACYSCGLIGFRISNRSLSFATT